MFEILAKKISAFSFYSDILRIFAAKIKGAGGFLGAATIV